MADAVRVPKLLTVKQLAAATGIPTWRIHQMAAQKLLPCLRVGRTYRFSEDAMVEWIKNNTTKEES